MARQIVKYGLLVGIIVAVSSCVAPPTAAPTAAPPQAAEPAATQPTEPAAPPAEVPSETVWSSVPLIQGTCCEPNTLDPAAVSNAATEGIIMNAAYEGLTRYTIEGEIEPALAASWKISDDSLTYTFNLREGVKFHDGSDLNAEAVKKSFERQKAVKLGVSFLLDSVSEIDVVDDMTVEFTLTQPDVTFWFGVPRIKIISAAALAANEQDGDWAQDYFRENIAGTGPYRLDRWDHGRQLEMIAFENYWQGWEGRHIQRFILRFGVDMASRLLSLEQGDMHIVDWAGLSDVRRVADNPDIQLITGRANWSQYYHWMDNQRGPLEDVRVRQAMLHAYPYEEMWEVMEGYAVPLDSPIPEYMIGYCKVFEPKQDLERASELLAEAGYADGFQVKQAYKIENEVRRLAAELFQEDLAGLGVEVVLEDIPWGNFLQAQSQKDTAYDFVSANAGSPVPWSGTLLFNLGHSSVQGTAGNYSWYANPEFDALIEEAQRLPPNDPKADDLLCQAQQKLIDEAAFIPVMINQYLEVRRAELKAPPFDSYGFPYDIHLYDMYLEE